MSHGCQELAIAGSQSRGEPERLIDHRFDWLRFRARTTGHRPVVVVVVVVAAVVPHPPHQPRTARVPEARIGSDQMLLLLLLLLLCRWWCCCCCCRRHSSVLVGCVSATTLDATARWRRSLLRDIESLLTWESWIMSQTSRGILRWRGRSFYAIATSLFLSRGVSLSLPPTIRRCLRDFYAFAWANQPTTLIVELM